MPIEERIETLDQYDDEVLLLTAGADCISEDCAPDHC